MTIAVELPDASVIDEVGFLLQRTQELRARFKPMCAALFPDDKKSMAKFRPGGEKIVLLIADAADSVELKIPGIPTDSLRQDLERARRLRPLLNEVELLAQEIRDAIFGSESHCWGGTTIYYTSLRGMSRAVPNLANALKEAVEFFAQGPRTEKDAAAVNASVELDVKVSGTT